MKMKLFLTSLFCTFSLLLANSLSLSDNGDGTFNVGYSSSDDIGGFQFNVDGATVNGASGGDAASNGFMMSTSATTVLGFSFTGGTIPAGEGTLLVLSVDGSPTGLSSIVVSDPAGGALDFTYEEPQMEITDGCDLPDLNMYLAEDGSVFYNSSEIIGGFQFNVDGATVSAASGGDAGAAGFFVQAAGSTVLGFSLTGATFGPGCGTMVELTLDGVASGLSGIVISDPDGQGIPFEYFDGGGEEPVWGCTDSDACNYDADATDDDGSCWSANAGCACSDGEGAEVDECGVCNGDGIPAGDCDCDGNVEDCAGECGGSHIWVTLCEDTDGDGLGNPGTETQECVEGGRDYDGCDLPDLHIFLNSDGSVIYNTSEAIGGFQFNVDGTTVGSASGGDAGGAGFLIQAAGNTVLGFSLTGATFGPGCGTMVNLGLNGAATGLSSIVVSDAAGQSIPFTYYVGDETDLVADCSDEYPDCADNFFDCNGDCGGSAENDDCGVCGGDNSTCADCAGVPNGNAYEDNCGTCDADPSNDCTQDCNGEWGGTAEVDECGVCDGPGAVYDCGCAEMPAGDCDCDGNQLDECGLCGGPGAVFECGCSDMPAGDCDCDGNQLDACGVCGGDDSSCADCAGTPNGNAVEDNCGVCDADPTNDCEQDCAGEWGGDAYEDECGECDADPSNDCDPGGECDNAPEWIDIPGAYEFTATMTSIVKLDGNQLGDEGDLLAGFDADGNVRGLAVQLHVPFGPYQGTILYEMQMRSNDEGDVLTFKYFDESECEIYDIAEDYTFIINDILGDVINPHELNVGGGDDCAEAPEWIDVPGAYEFTATMTSIVLNEGVQLGDEGDQLAGFDASGTVRGLAVQLHVPFGPYQGTILYEMQMRSNDEGDVLTFKYYDASECAIYDIEEDYTFIINDILGDVITPWELNVGSGSSDCVDDDSAVAPFTCAQAVANWGCDFVWGDSTVGELCPVSCDNCPGEEECVDDDSAVAPFTCEEAVATWGCDFVWGDSTIGELCPESCGECGEPVFGCTDSAACNFNPDATDDDGSCWSASAGCDCADGEGAAVDECGVCNGPGAIFDCGCADMPDGDCDCDGNQLDECGVCGGPGAIFECGCADIPAGDCDCDGNVEDACGVCGGDDSSCADCAGVPNGDNELDNCGVCDNDSSNDCEQDCNGEWGGSAELDECGVCDGPGAVFECGCEDIAAGECDCDGNVEDDCGVCGGDGSTCAPPDEFAYNQSTMQAFYFFMSATINGETLADDDWVGAFNGDVCVGSRMWGDCDGGSGCEVPAMGYDGSEFTMGYMTPGVAPSFRIYDASTGSYLEAIASQDNPWAPNGMFIIDSLANVITGCMDMAACNYNENANTPGECEYADENYDCDGNCTAELDCNGECGGSAALDECGVCEGPGAVFECGCADIPDGDCDCDGNVEDACGVCGGDDSSCADCAGVPNGDNELDNCGVCDNDSSNDCEQDCNGDWGGSAEVDECGVCDGPGAVFECGCEDIAVGECDCDGNIVDGCGVCGGDNSTCDTPELFEYNQSTQQAYYFFYSASIDGVELDANDWVGAFKDDVCVGSRKWDVSLCGGGVCDVPVMGEDNGYEWTFGYMLPGEIPSFKVFDASENMYYDAVASEDVPWMNNELFMIDNVNVEQDCAGDLGGDAELDDCGVCNGGNADMDCAGECFGDAYEDDCGVCDDDASNDNADMDCAGECFGDAE